MLTAILNFPMDRMAPTVVLESVLFIYRCDICSATFNLQKNLALHVAAHQTENLICPGEHFTGRKGYSRNVDHFISVCFQRACVNFLILMSPVSPVFHTEVTVSWSQR